MSNRICVAIQIQSGDLSKNRALIEDALNSRPNLIELRLDYIDKIEALTEDFINSLINLIEPEVPVILTLRDSSEGGQMDIDDKLRIELIQMIIKCRPSFLDIEMNTEKQILKDLITLATQNAVHLIFSYHDFEKTPKYKDAIQILEKFTNSINLPEKAIVKAIFTAQSIEDNIIPLKICADYQYKELELVCFCMGEKGIFSRIACVKAGSFMTYASISDATAPGQIKIEKIREFHQLLE